MALESTDIDAKLDEMASTLRSLRAAGQQVRATTNRAVSELAQFSQGYSEVIEAVEAIEESTNPVDQFQVAKLAKITAEATDLYGKVVAVKAGIDQLGL